MAGTNVMEPNIGLTDRYFRTAVGGLLLAAGAARLARNPDLGAVGIGLLGGMMLAEGVLGTCPLYHLAGIDTREREREFNDVIQGPGQGI